MKDVANSGGLLQLRRDALELGVQAGTEPVHYSDDGDGDACCDQAIFNGGRAGLTRGKSFYAPPHDHSHLSILRRHGEGPRPKCRGLHMPS